MQTVIKDLLKQIGETQTALEFIENMSEKTCRSINGLSKEECSENIKHRLSELKKRLKAEKLKTLSGTDKIITEIAIKNIVMVNERGDLETANCDEYDFIDVAVWELKNALIEAYNAGKNSK